MNESSHEPLPSGQGSWSSFMCPSCRGLFRVPPHKAGEAQCPLCESTIQIPRREEPSPVENDAQPNPPLKKKRRTPPSNNPSWDEKGSKSNKNGPGRGAIFTTLFLFSVVLVVSGVLFVKERDRRLNLSNKGRPSAARAQGSDSASRDSFFDFSRPSGKDSQEPLLEIESGDLETAREAASVFLNTENLEELAPLIRDPERVMPLIREYYRETPYEAAGVLSVDEEGVSQVSKRFTSFNIVLRDYSSRPIAVEISDNGPLVDWESWVAYCEIPWETFIEEQVTEPTVVRVHAKQAFYYNFSFRDDSKWTCFRLASSIDGSVIYGYAPTDATFLKELPGPNDPEATFILKIRFPEPITTSNQVLITDVLQIGWVLGL